MIGMYDYLNGTDVDDSWIKAHAYAVKYFAFGHGGLDFTPERHSRLVEAQNRLAGLSRPKHNHSRRCGNCGQFEGDGAMFTTLANSDICDDCA